MPAFPHIPAPFISHKSNQPNPPDPQKFFFFSLPSSFYLICQNVENFPQNCPLTNEKLTLEQ